MAILSLIKAGILIALFIVPLISLLAPAMWPLSLFSNFSVQTLFASLALFMMYLMHARFKPALIALLAGGLSVLSIAHSPALPSHERTSFLPGNSLRILHANLLGNANALEALLNNMDEKAGRPDIIVLTELPGGVVEGDHLTSLFSTHGSRVFSAVGGPARVLIASRHPIIKGERHHSLIIEAIVKMPGERDVSIISMHPPPPITQMSGFRRNRALQIIFSVGQQKDVPTIILGDFNALPWDRTLRDAAQQSGFARVTSGRFQPTWVNRMAPFGLTIDHIYATSHFQTQSFSVGPPIGSDHFPIEATLRLSQ